MRRKIAQILLLFFIIIPNIILLSTIDVKPATIKTEYSIIFLVMPCAQYTPMVTERLVVTPSPIPTPEPTPIPTPVPTPEPTPKREELLGTFMATAYCPCTECSHQYGYSTASGARATEGLTIAADLSVIPMWTRVRVEVIDSNWSKFSQEYVVQDVGSSIKGNKIDIFMESHSEGNAFGVRQVRVYKILS